MTARLYSLPGGYSTSAAPSLQEKLQNYQAVIRLWRRYLTSQEFEVVIDLIDRTIAWGRHEVYVSSREMVEASMMSRSTLFRTINKLEKRNIVQRRKDTKVPDRVYFSVNFGWLDAEQNQCRSETIQCQVETTPSQIETLYNSIKEPVSENNITLAPPPVSRPLASIEQVRAVADTASRADGEHRAAKAASERACVSIALEASWRNALAEAFPGHAASAWGVREKAQAKRAAKNWIRSNAISFAEFINWSVLNWTAIMRKQFKWMTKSPPPAMPTFSFFIAMQGHFADCHADGTLDKWANAKERTEVERLMARGMTYEQATIEHGKNHATKTLRSEMEEREIRARSNEQTAERKLEQARKLVEYGGAAPVHPRSRLALEARARSRTVQPVAKPDSALPEAKVYFVDPERNPFD